MLRIAGTYFVSNHEALIKMVTKRTHISRIRHNWHFYTTHTKEGGLGEIDTHSIYWSQERQKKNRMTYLKSVCKGIRSDRKIFINRYKELCVVERLDRLCPGLKVDPFELYTSSKTWYIYTLEKQAWTSDAAGQFATTSASKSIERCMKRYAIDNFMFINKMEFRECFFASVFAQMDTLWWVSCTWL